MATNTDPNNCHKCLLDFEVFPPGEARNCPNCGELIDRGFTSSRKTEPRSLGVVSTTPGAALELAKRFFQNVFEIIVAPQKFFKKNAELILSEEGLSSALAFSVIVHWIAAFFNFVWSSTLTVLFSQKIKDFFQVANEVVDDAGSGLPGIDRTGTYFYNLLMSAGSLVLSPFLTLIQLVISAFFIHFGVRLFMSTHEGVTPKYTTTLKILAYCSASMFLCVIPGVGIFLAFLLWMVPAVVGLSTVYRSTGTRAVFAIATPMMLFGLVVLLLVFIFAVLGLGLLRLAI